MNFRRLQFSDFKKGYLDLLQYLTNVGNGDIEQRFLEIQSIFPFLQIWVLECIEQQKIVGSITILIEPKIIHSCKKAGHIEDVVVHKDYQGKGYGKILVEKAVEICKREDCYKVILNCSEKNQPFYEKCGFIYKNRGMSLYLS